PARPLVVVADDYPRFAGCAVLFDRVAVGRLAIRHLVGCGVERIALLAPAVTPTTARMRALIHGAQGEARASGVPIEIIATSGAERADGWGVGRWLADR